jgi:DNA-directed RNA polymerase subunit RPC12/RpoP
MVKSTPARVVFIDIETAPSLGWVWGKWQQDVIDFKADWYVLSFAVKEPGQKVRTYCLADYPGYENAKEDDKKLIQELWKVLDEADIVIAHNGDRFDVPKINTRFLIHGLKPPSPYKTVDTLQVARKVFKFDSNKLDEVGRCLGIGRKLAHTGFHLWQACMQGDLKAWKKMKRYNGRDIILLERVYFMMRPWMKNHPNVNQGEIYNCPKCGSDRVQRRGWAFTLLRKKQRFQCQHCGGWFEGSAVKVDK